MTVEFLDPRSPAAPAAVTLTPPPRSLEGITIGLVDNSKANAWFLLDWLGERLSASHGVHLVPIRKRVPSDPLTPAQLEELTSQCDLVLTAMGD
ncbi:hypothetical protein CLV71_101607 [Actinophytocola oryzae]|uniref:UGSC-like domain-containing protein n=2 Tax=Actinophytocola oryzae TaxID=502181 RepID=A0A4R7W552_9PSEU|nr:hypothetical protein [Actinophytocola oryzae]TDV57734.1 hypothetical protein CLV71_101607 [Actinophytocola oryzae]